MNIQIKKMVTGFPVVVLASLFGLLLGISLRSAYAWSEPAAAPPSVNVGAPITTGGAAQTKSGTFGINTWDSQLLTGYQAQRRSIGGANGWDPNVLYINGFNDWSSGISIGGNTYIGGNANINDVYIRAAGKWASQLGGGSYTSSCVTIGNAAQGRWYSDGARPTCPAGYVMTGIQTWGGCSGGVCGSNIVCCK